MSEPSDCHVANQHIKPEQLDDQNLLEKVYEGDIAFTAAHDYLRARSALELRLCSKISGPVRIFEGERANSSAFVDTAIEKITNTLEENRRRSLQLNTKRIESMVARHKASLRHREQAISIGLRSSMLEKHLVDLKSRQKDTQTFERMEDSSLDEARTSLEKLKLDVSMKAVAIDAIREECEQIRTRTLCIQAKEKRMRSTYGISFDTPCTS